jgi:hypothetical protein
VYRQNRCRAPQSLPVVFQVGPVRGADFAEAGAALEQDVGNAEGATDLDQLPAGDQHLATFRHGIQR